MERRLHHVPKTKKESSHQYPQSLKDKDSKASTKTKLESHISLPDIQIKGSVTSKLIPGSLGEMLLKNHIKDRLQTIEQESTALTLKSNDFGVMMENEKTKPFELTNLDEGVKNTRDYTQVENDDDEEDELTLRYRALQSAVQSCNSDSLFGSDLFKILDATRRDLEKAAKTRKLFDIYKNDIEQGILGFADEMKNKITLGNDNAKDGFEITCENTVLKDKCETVMVDMEISNDSINENANLHEDEKQGNNKIDQSISKLVQLKTESNSKENEFFGDLINQDSQLHFPVEWAYMIPPPAQPGQPDNNLNSVNSWCFNQNMFVQSMEEMPTQELNQDLSWQFTKVAKPSSESYAGYNHLYQYPFQSKDILDETLSSNTPQESFETNSREFSYQSQPKENSQNNELRDVHAEHYRTFMSTFLNNNCQRTFNKKNENQRNLIEINLKPLIKNKGQKIPTVTSKMLHHSLPHKKKVRRRRKSTRKSIGTDNSKDTQMMVSKDESTNITSNECPIKKNDLGYEEDEDEDILRAQLLKDMALKNQSLSSNINEQNEHLTHKMQNCNRPHSQNVLKNKPLSKNGSKFSRKWLKTEKETNICNKASSAANIKRPLKSIRRLDIGGNYLDPKNRFCDAPHTDNFSLSKFPPVKPVVIPLNKSSDSEISDTEPIPVENNCDSVISGIFELIKSCRNSLETTQEKKKETLNEQTPKVSFIYMLLIL